MFIRKALEVFGFRQKIIRWIGILYTNASCCIISNNFLSEFFSVTRGVRQGDSLSPTLIVCFSNRNSSNLIRTKSSGRFSSMMWIIKLHYLQMIL